MNTTSTTITTTPVGLGRAIMARRTILGIKRKALAETVGISYPYLSEAENGKKIPSMRVIAAIASGLGLTLAELQVMADAPLGAPLEVFMHAGTPAPAPEPPTVADPTMADIMAELRALRRLVEELTGGR